MKVSASVNRKVEQGQATRRLILDTATTMFAEEGYTVTSIEQVLQRTGAARGSLYYHFASKERLFEAVLERVASEITARIMATSATAGDPVAMLRSGCEAWLSAAEDSVARRILLREAPAVLGWERWREFDSRHGLGLIRLALEAIADGGGIEAKDVNFLSHVLSAMLGEAALLVAGADDPATARADGLASINRVIDGIVRS